jgi:hypothetical protein
MVFLEKGILQMKEIPITYIVWWYKTLYQVQPVVWTSITTSHESDEFWCGLFTPQAWYKVLHQHTMYEISLSNISIKTNFKQITRVEIRSTNLYNTLGRLHFVHDVMLFVAVHCFALLTQLTLACFLRIPMIWRHDKVVRQRRSRILYLDFRLNLAIWLVDIVLINFSAIFY